MSLSTQVVKPGKIASMDYRSYISDSFDLYLFDLDGTLIDSLDDLTVAMNATLARYGIGAVDRETVRRGIGNGAKKLVHRTFTTTSKIDETDLVTLVEKAVPEYRAEYERHCTEKTVLYPGIREWLRALKKQGATLAVLTNKPEDLALRILHELDADSFFEHIYGPETAGALKPDPIGIHRIIEKTGTTQERAIMIGDSEVDILTARNAGIACCGITGGLGNSETIRSLKPDYLIERADPVWCVQTGSALQRQRKESE